MDSDERIAHLRVEIDDLKQELKEVKQLLRQIEKEYCVELHTGRGKEG